jgi:sialate O-acetylesterase
MAQTESLKIERTGMAVAIDLADADNPNDIHPKNKLDVGYRLARWALAKDYGIKDMVYSGPVLKSVTPAKDSITVECDCGKSPLMIGEKVGIAPTKDVTATAELKGFAVAGSDGNYVNAQARIKGKHKVILTCKEIPEPLTVRYAYTMNPAGCNLYNQAGLPAGPFTSDDSWQ